MFTKNNQTAVTEFMLLGFEDLYQFKIPFFVLLTIIYVVTSVGNLVIIALISSCRSLQSPMYIFLGHLSVCDLLISTNVTPNALRIILLGKALMSFLSCITQLYFVGATLIMECFLLAVMSYDRYLAICCPLHYSSIMNTNVPHYLVLGTWLLGFSQSLITHSFILNTQFCASNIVNHFFCDLGPILQLSCSDTIVVQIEVSTFSIVTVLSQVLFIIVTYGCIFKAIHHISSVTGREKVFSTCSSHLTVVCIYYGSLMILYVAPSKDNSFNLNKILSLLNSVFTPLFNPIVYSLRNKEIGSALKKIKFIKLCHDKYF
ncbi:olfactory receptor 6F1-like [Lithobates pipiens]